MTEQETRERLQEGLVIPAMPLALDAHKKFDEKHQRGVIRYYLNAGAGGIAAGVHTTQFEIRKHGELFQQVLSVTAEEIDRFAGQTGAQIVKIGGVLGKRDQAVREASLLRSLGYDAGLVSLSAFQDAPINEIVEHCRAVSEVIPIVGFYLQTAVGGVLLPYEFWKQFVELEHVLAVKVAPFNRYRTIDVVRAVAESSRHRDIALYTGNDDSIVVDLLSSYQFQVEGSTVELGFVGGLLGQWAVWTKAAVDLLDKLHSIKRSGEPVPQDVLTYAQQLTDANAALFDAKNGFAGSIAGIHEILRRQGLFAGVWCLEERERLSPGQSEEITRVVTAYPHLTDDDFVAANLERWLSAG